MLKLAVICMLISTVLFAIGCFLAKGKKWSVAFQIFSLISLAGLGLCVSSLKIGFSGYSALIIFSLIPQIAIVLAPNSKKESPQKKSINKRLWIGICNFLSAVLLGISAFYLGKENVFGYLFGILVSIAITCLLLALKKHFSLADLFGNILTFLSVGFILGQILLVLLYAFSLKNGLFAIGGVLFAIYCLLKSFKDNKYENLALYLAMLAFIATFIL